MRVTMLGLRGIPATEGGIERHVEALSPLLVELGNEVEVVLRSPYRPNGGREPWRGVRRTWIWSPRRSGLETIVQSFLGLLYAALIRRPDILHIHGIGPSLMTPMARLLGLRVVTTHHGFDYDREKWGPFARMVLKLGEWAGARFSNERIVISNVIKSSVQTRFSKPCTVIPNGVFLPELSRSTTHIDTYGITPKRYILHVSRFVPEKRHLDLIHGFEMAGLTGWHLVMVGGCDGDDAYTHEVKAAARRVPNVVLTGFQSGQTLKELYSNAAAFVLPSSHEGLPIALLEAMSYGLPVIASDIPAHEELSLAPNSYFELGNLGDLAEKIKDLINLDWDRERSEQQRIWIAERYDWATIASQINSLYSYVLATGPLDSAPARH